MSDSTDATILYADGNARVRQSLAAVLRQAGFAVREATTATEALRLARDGPALVILDGSLPDMPSAELGRQLRADPATHTLPLLRLAHPGAEPEPHLLEGEGCLPHPVDPRQLVSQVRTLVRLHRAEADLRASEARLRDILDNAPVVVHVKDRQGRYLLVNRHWETLFHRRREDVLGKTVHDFYPRPQADAFRANDRMVLESGEPLQFEEVAPEDDGPHLFLSVKFPLANSGGVPYAVCGISTDITHRKRAEAELARTAVEFGIARRIQQRLFPGPLDSTAHLGIPPGRIAFDVGGASYPAEAIGGDYYDYLPLRGGLGLAVGDVSGHGIGPALLTAEVRAFLRAFAQTQADPGIIFALTNRVLVPDIDDDRFVTLVLARFDSQTASLTYASAGHPAGYVLDAAGDIKVRLDSNSLPLGIVADGPFATSHPVPLEPGDVILFLTDGLTDARSPEGSPFGLTRTLDVLRAARHSSAQAIVRELYARVVEFSDGVPQPDDITAAVVKVLPGPEFSRGDPRDGVA